jgi:hypothetical protein
MTLLPALLLMVTEPLRVPPVVGVNTTFTVHEPFAGTLVPQLLVCEKSPDATIELIGAALDPVLETVTARAALLVFTACEPKSSEEGLAVKPPTGGGNTGVGCGVLQTTLVIQLPLPPLLMMLN